MVLLTLGFSSISSNIKYGSGRLGKTGSLHRETLAPCGLLHVSVLQMQGLFVLGRGGVLEMMLKPNIW